MARKKISKETKNSRETKNKPQGRGHLASAAIGILAALGIFGYGAGTRGFGLGPGAGGGGAGAAQESAASAGMQAEARNAGTEAASVQNQKQDQPSDGTQLPEGQEAAAGREEGSSQESPADRTVVRVVEVTIDADGYIYQNTKQSLSDILADVGEDDIIHLTVDRASKNRVYRFLEAAREKGIKVVED